MVIGFCIDVVMGMVVVEVVGHCGMLGYYFIVLEVL